MPNDWNTAILCSVHKKSSKLERSNYRDISFLNITYKIFTNILAKCTGPHADQSFGKYQSGFHSNRSKQIIYLLFV